MPSPRVTTENDDSEKQSRSETPKSHQQQSSPSPFDTSHMTTKLLTPPANFDAFFSRPHPQFNFYPHHLLNQPLNFSTNRLPFPSMLPQSPILPPIPSSQNSNNGNANNFMDDLYKKEKLLQEKRMKPANLKKIDRIAESLRFGANSTSPPSSSSPSSAKSFLEHFNQMTVKKEQTPPNSAYSLSPNTLQSTQFMMNDKNSPKPTIENLLNYSNDGKKATQGNQTTTTVMPNNQPGTPTKIPNSKLFAKCFICSKLLSNQYNLRVHLETHQNMRLGKIIHWKLKIILYEFSDMSTLR